MEEVSLKQKHDHSARLENHKNIWVLKKLVEIESMVTVLSLCLLESMKGISR